MALCMTAESPAAIALVADLAERVAIQQATTRGNVRQARGLEKLSGAVGAIVGALLDAWGGHGEPLPARRSRKRDGFSGGPVKFVAWEGTIGSLLSLGLIQEAVGVRFAAPGSAPGENFFRGWEARFWPSDALTSVAMSHGVTPRTVRNDFRVQPSTSVPNVRQPVQLRHLILERRWEGVTIRALAAALSDPEHAIAQADVEAQNELAARTQVDGCTPPRWYRVFSGTWALHGRWYAAGSEGTYQSTGQTQRNLIGIGGSPVVELDIKGSHLTILRALSGDFPVGGDPFEIPGFTREAVKRWALETMGRGRGTDRWSPKKTGSHRAESAAAVEQAMIEKHPFLSNPSVVVPEELAAALGVTRDELLSHYLMGVEAQAMTLAMRDLREAGILALPVHDSLIVPKAAEGLARKAIAERFTQVCGVAPNVDVK
jgi:hypothetical protein